MTVQYPTESFQSDSNILTPSGFVPTFNPHNMPQSDCEESKIMNTKLMLSLVLLALFSVAAVAQQLAPSKTHLKVGDKAPDFTLRATDGKTYKLSDFKGQKNVVLAIYVLAFTGG